MPQPINPDDIPTAITRETYSMTRSLIEAGVPVLSQNDTAKFLAHYWPAIEQHIRQQIAEQIEAVDPVDWALAGQHAGKDAAAIVRGTDTASR